MGLARLEEPPACWRDAVAYVAHSGGRKLVTAPWSVGSVTSLAQIALRGLVWVALAGGRLLRGSARSAGSGVRTGASGGRTIVTDVTKARALVG